MDKKIRKLLERSQQLAWNSPLEGALDLYEDISDALAKSYCKACFDCKECGENHDKCCVDCWQDNDNGGWYCECENCDECHST